MQSESNSGSKAQRLLAGQVSLKEGYRRDPATAQKTLTATGRIDRENLAFHVDYPGQISPAGLHPCCGGDEGTACSVELMLASLACCAGVTCAAVGNALNIEWDQAKITVSGSMDFRGTLGVDRETPVGLTNIEMIFDIQSTAAPAMIEKLVQLTERYCVVLQTFVSVPRVVVKIAGND